MLTSQIYRWNGRGRWRRRWWLWTATGSSSERDTEPIDMAPNIAVWDQSSAEQRHLKRGGSSYRSQEPLPRTINIPEVLEWSTAKCIHQYRRLAAPSAPGEQLSTMTQGTAMILARYHGSTQLRGSTVPGSIIYSHPPDYTATELRWQSTIDIYLCRWRSNEHAKGGDSADQSSSTDKLKALRQAPRSWQASLPSRPRCYWSRLSRGQPWSRPDGLRCGFRKTITKSMLSNDDYRLQDILYRACGSTSQS